VCDESEEEKEINSQGSVVCGMKIAEEAVTHTLPSASKSTASLACLPMHRRFCITKIFQFSYPRSTFTLFTLRNYQSIMASEVPVSSLTTSASRSSSGPLPADSSATKSVRKIKFDPSLLPPSSDPAEILKQVEFYFSDANLPRDKFLWTLTQSDPKKEGWVSIQQIASFARMQRFGPQEAIVDALRTSKELLEVSEDGTCVRRKIPLVKPSQQQFHDINNRSIHVVCFL
jgi:hypothetical protein